MFTNTQRRRFNRNKKKNDLKVSVPRSLQPSTLMPTELVKTFEFRPTTTILATGTADYAVAEYKLNSPYDPEQISGGSQPAGFNSIMAFYNYCLVEGVSVKLQVANREPEVNITVGWVLRDSRPTTLINDRDSAILTFGVGPRVEPKLLGTSAGQNRATLVQPYISLPSILGNPYGYQGGINYVCAANTDPSQLLWGAVVMYSEEGAIFLPNGITYELVISMKTKFFSLRTEIP